MKRGDIVIAAPPGDYGKPRPVFFSQNDFYALPSVTVSPLTSDLPDAPLFRIPLAPDADNGLQKLSHLMIDKAVTLPRTKIAQHVGSLDAATMRTVNRALAAFFGFDEMRS